ncbi:MAG: Formyltransferase family protein [Flavipsychrobacter sp.]|nr:Formyltransferase family protein [Flavipsychrobacter sp.]
MKVIILTTSVYGTTGHHLPLLVNCKDIEIAMVIVSEGQVTNKQSQIKKRLKKILKIGVFGAFNGIRMRKWYTDDMKAYCKITNAEQFCKEHNIPFRKVPHTNSAETQQLFRETAADIGLSLGNGYISEKVFKLPRLGMLNIHHELLPEYQNAQSIIWELYNGSVETGYTIHKINKDIDKGAIVLQEKMPIVFRETLADTVAYNYAKLFDASADGLIRLFKDFESLFAKAQPQQKGKTYTTPSLWQFLKIERQFKKLKEQAASK